MLVHQRVTALQLPPEPGWRSTSPSALRWASYGPMDDGDGPPADPHCKALGNAGAQCCCMAQANSLSTSTIWVWVGKSQWKWVQWVSVSAESSRRQQEHEANANGNPCSSFEASTAYSEEGRHNMRQPSWEDIADIISTYIYIYIHMYVYIYISLSIFLFMYICCHV